MDITIIFLIIVMFYFCIIFPFQLRRYVMIRRQRADAQRRIHSYQADAQRRINSQLPPSYINHRSNTAQRNNNQTSSEQQSDHRHFVFNVPQTSPDTESQRDDAAARYLETEHRQQIIEIQREIERQATQRREGRDANNTNSSSAIDPVAVYSEQIINLQRDIEQQAIRRQQETVQRQQELRDSNNPHMPPRLINSSTVRTSIFTIAPGSMTGNSNSNANYPYAPPLTPDGYRDGHHIHFTNRSNTKDDELPSYEQAIAFETTTETVTISRY